MASDVETARPTRVLIIDDDPTIATTYFDDHTREYSRHEYVAINTAEEGLSRLREPDGEFDIVIVDYELNPGWSAPKFIEQAKAIRPLVPYVIWSVQTEKDMFESLRRVSVDAMLRMDASGFIEKRNVLHRTDALDAYIDDAVDRFRQQIVAHLASAMIGPLREVELALTQVTTIRRGLDKACDADEAERTVPVRPLRLHALQAERRLRRLLSYRGHRELSQQEHLAAIEELLSERATRKLPKKVAGPLRELAHRGALPPEKARAFVLELERCAEDENTQSAIAECVSELTDLLVAAGRNGDAIVISSEVWSTANTSWTASPRVVCAISHAWTLASCGERGLAEQLAAGILTEVQPDMAEGHYEEISRMVMAEIDGRSRVERAV